MKRKIFQGTIAGLFLLIMLCPLVQQVTRVAPEPLLQEKRVLVERPQLSLSSLMSGEYQEQFDGYMNDNFGFRSWVVLINNQINLSVFRVTR